MNLTTRPHAKSTTSPLIIHGFKCAGRHRSQTGMQALDVVDIVDKLANMSRRLLKGLILPEVNLLLLEGLKETFGFGVVVGMVATQPAELAGGRTTISANYLTMVTGSFIPAS